VCVARNRKSDLSEMASKMKIDIIFLITSCSIKFRDNLASNSCVQTGRRHRMYCRRVAGI
jgi:hypothetical protein